MSRKDDLLNLFYLLIYFGKGSLPWFSYIKHHEDSCEKYEFVKKVNHLKQMFSTEQTCLGLPCIILLLYLHLI